MDESGLMEVLAGEAIGKKEREALKNFASSSLFGAIQNFIVGLLGDDAEEMVPPTPALLCENGVFVMYVNRSRYKTGEFFFSFDAINDRYEIDMKKAFVGNIRKLAKSKRGLVFLSTGRYPLNDLTIFSKKWDEHPATKRLKDRLSSYQQTRRHAIKIDEIMGSIKPGMEEEVIKRLEIRLGKNVEGEATGDIPVYDPIEITVTSTQIEPGGELSVKARYNDHFIAFSVPETNCYKTDDNKVSFMGDGVVGQTFTAEFGYRSGKIAILSATPLKTAPKDIKVGDVLWGRWPEDAMGEPIHRVRVDHVIHEGISKEDLQRRGFTDYGASSMLSFFDGFSTGGVVYVCSEISCPLFDGADGGAVIYLNRELNALIKRGA